MNKVGGFLQRIDYARKYAFGAMCILKDDKGQFPIRGAWIFRGQAIPPMMVEVRSLLFFLRSSSAAALLNVLIRKRLSSRAGQYKNRRKWLGGSSLGRQRKTHLCLSLRKKFKKTQKIEQECYDLDLYNWTKVDVTNAEQKKRVEDMFAEEEKIDGLEHVECKIFK